MLRLPGSLQRSPTPKAPTRRLEAEMSLVTWVEARWIPLVQVWFESSELLSKRPAVYGPFGRDDIGDSLNFLTACGTSCILSHVL